MCGFGARVLSENTSCPVCAGELRELTAAESARGEYAGKMHLADARDGVVSAAISAMPLV